MAVAKGMSFFILPGFLGLASDFEFISDFQNTSSGSLIKEVYALDLFRRYEERGDLGLWTFAKKYNEWAEKQVLRKKRKKIFFGYSLGGRLGLHALINNPSQWDAAVIVSSHTGLLSQKERESRIESDELLSKRFAKDSLIPFAELLEEWNNNPLFQGKPFPLPREEKSFSREALSFALSKYSLGRQEDLTPFLSCIPLPILWVVGENDLFSTVRQEFLHFSHPQSRKHVITNGSHRLLWEQKEAFFNVLDQFLQEICKEGAFDIPISKKKEKVKVS